MYLSRGNLFSASILAVFLGLSSTLYGAGVVISLANPSGLQGNETAQFEEEAATWFDTNNHAAFEPLYSTFGNLDAFHIRDNGNYLVSSHIGFTIQGVEFADGEVAEVIPSSGVATSFVNFESILTGGDVDIDAFSEHPDGRYLFSTLGEGQIAAGPDAGLSFTEKDIIAYDPATQAASVFVDGALLQGEDRFINVSGISMIDDSRVGISVKTGGVSDVTLGGLTFQRNDAVVFDLDDLTATSLIEGSQVFVGPPNPGIDALHVTSAVPEPSSRLLLLSALVLLTRAKQRRQLAYRMA